MLCPFVGAISDGFEHSRIYVKSLKLRSSIPTIDYTYNERDWLSAINDVNNIGTEKFAERLHYNTVVGGVAAAGQFNGNIAAVETYNGAIAENKRMAYGFSYDGANRLTAANNFVYSTSSYQASNNWGMPAIGYDGIGNIGSLQRRNASGILSDDYTYHYSAGTSRLDSVRNGSMTMKYLYDANGNVIHDAHRGLSVIEYDLKNLPTTVYTTGGQMQVYTYNTDGERIRKYPIGGTDTYYVTGLGGKTEVVLTSPNKRNYTVNITGNDVIGQITVTPTVTSRYYYLKDHLGSIRATVDETGAAMSYDDYYPFGLVMDGRSYVAGGVDARLKYIGIERDVETGYDHNGDRSYDSRIARSMTLDPFAWKDPFRSPYSYAGNNPVSFYDAHGDSVWICDGNERALYTIGMDPTGNKFMTDVIKRLNRLGSEDAGKELLGGLIASGGNYNYRQGAVPAGADGQFNAAGKTAYGGDVILSNYDFGTIAHESYHAYEHQMNLGGASLWSETQADAFQYMMEKAVGIPGHQLGRNDGNGSTNLGSGYFSDMDSYMKNFSDDNLWKSISGFLSGSQANSGKAYDYHVPAWGHQENKNLLRQLMRHK